MADMTSLLKGVKHLFPADEQTWCQLRQPDHAARAIISSLLVEFGPGLAARAEAGEQRMVLLREYLAALGPLKLNECQLALRNELLAFLAAGTPDSSASQEFIVRLMAAFVGNPLVDVLHAKAARAESRCHLQLLDAYEAETQFLKTEASSANTPAPVLGREQILDGLGRAGFDVSQLSIETIQPILGGFSKQTLVCHTNGKTLTGNRFVVRAETGLPYGGASIREEYATAKALFRHGVKVPKPLACQTSGGTSGPFMIMEWADGTMMGFVPTFRDDALCREVGYQLGLVHGIPVGEFAHVPGANVRTMEQMLDDIAVREKKWRDAGGTDAVVAYSLKWLRDRVELTEGARSVIHGDYRGHNILQKDGKLTAVLDWEHARIANPAQDLGYVRAFGEALGSWDAFMEGYTAGGGKRPDPQVLHYHEVFACMFIIAVLTEISHNYHGEVNQQLATAASVVHRRPLEMARLIKLLNLR